MAREHAPDATEVEVRMDSKLVIEQMAGRWKIKHESMKPLAVEARRLLPASVTWTWVPREQNAAADALANAALDDEAAGGAGKVGEPGLRRGRRGTPTPSAQLGWRGGVHGEPTTIILLRHGVTQSTERKLFCGSGGADPGLTQTGVEQAQRAATLAQATGGVDAIVSSPMQRTRETAAVVAGELGLDVELEAGLAEAAFGEWDGFTFAEIMERWPAELDDWLGSTAVAPPGGEPFDAVDERVAAAARPDPRGIRRQDGRRGEPRDADQDDGAPHPRCTDAGHLQDGAVAGVDHDDPVVAGRHLVAPQLQRRPGLDLGDDDVEALAVTLDGPAEVGQHRLQLVDRSGVGAGLEQPSYDRGPWSPC